jgi:CheY-like chemotaxis protein
MSAILVIDDTPDCLEPLSRLLRLLGHTVACAEHGQAALAVLADFKPDLVILDLMMPVMDGVGFLEHIRRDRHWKDLAVIVFTGAHNGINVARLAELGVSQMFIKGSGDYARLIDAIGPAHPITSSQRA